MIVPEGVVVFDTFEKALDFCEQTTKKLIKQKMCDDVINKPKIFVIGGERLYKEAINNNECDKIYITHIYKDFDCDKYFPEIPKQFKLISISDFNNYEKTYFRYLVYQQYELIPKYQKIWHNSEEEQYLSALKDIRDNGTENIEGLVLEHYHYLVKILNII